MEISKRKIYEKSNDDPHYLLFDKYNAQIHEPFREMLHKYKNTSVSHLVLLYSTIITLGRISNRYLSNSTLLPLGIFYSVTGYYIPLS